MAALDSAPQKHFCWFHYVDNTFIVWPNEPDKLKDFLDQCIQFTMEAESESHLSFLDKGIYRRYEGSLGHRVDRKLAHTNLYLNARSHNHPFIKQAVLSTLVHRARALCDGGIGIPDGLSRQNGYNNQQIHRALNHHPNIGQPDNKQNSVAFLPYVGPIFNRISSVGLIQYQVCGRLPHRKVSSFLLLLKDNLGLRTPGIYRISCECDRVYTGQTGHSVGTRLKEVQQHNQLEHPDMSAIAENSVNLGHCIQFHNTVLPS
jgi:hypothetical protein